MESHETSQKFNRQWEEAAHENPYRYIAYGWHENEARYAASGLKDAGRIMEICSRIWSNTQDKSALEIGCGNGRLMRFLGSCFFVLDGIDISPEMVRLAKANMLTHGVETTRVALVGELFNVPDYDLIYSYVVLQHCPIVEIQKYFRLAYDRLKEDGAFVFQLPVSDLPTSEADKFNAVGWWSKTDLVLALRSVGFSRISIDDEDRHNFHIARK